MPETLGRKVTDAKYGKARVYAGDASRAHPRGSRKWQSGCCLLIKSWPLYRRLLREIRQSKYCAMPMPDQRADCGTLMNRLADLVEQSNANGVIFISKVGYILLRQLRQVETAA